MNLYGLSEDQKTIKVNLVAKPVPKNKAVTCNGCYFLGRGKCSNSFCDASNRKDGKNIIWVEEK